MATDEKKVFKLGGLPWWQAVIAVALCAIPMYWGIQSKSMVGTLCSCFALAVILYELGERLPIWNNYIGGGLLMAFFGVALLKYFKIIPEEALENINRVISGDEVNLLEMYIIFLISGSVLALEKDILIKSFAGYIPTILGGLLFAGIFGVAAGLLFGVAPTTTIMKYVLPIMGGGNVAMALAIVAGGAFGAGLIGYVVGFYPVDAALTAGLCMANRGGSGDLACLGAAKRMDLMAYAQLSSRLGGGIVLIIASFMFSFWLK